MERGVLRYIYYPDDRQGLDITPYVDGGASIDVKRNTIGTCSIKTTYRALYRLLKATRMTAEDFLVEWFSRLDVVDEQHHRVFSGVLNTFPELSMNDIDAGMTLEFSSWLALTQGYQVRPQTWTNVRLDTILVEALQQGNKASDGGREPWNIGIGDVVQLAKVTWTLDSPKTLCEFLTQRTDNVSGAGLFDITIDAEKRFDVLQPVGRDTDIVLQYGGPGSNTINADYPAWSDYYTSVYVTGAGNSYGAVGTTLQTEASNGQSLARHYFYEKYSQNSDITDMDQLNEEAQRQLKYSATPATAPTLTISPTALGLHMYRGGDLWLGDTVALNPLGLFKLYPHTDRARVNEIALTIDNNNMQTAKLGMVMA